MKNGKKLVALAVLAFLALVSFNAECLASPKIKDDGEPIKCVVVEVLQNNTFVVAISEREGIFGTKMTVNVSPALIKRSNPQISVNDTVLVERNSSPGNRGMDGTIVAIIKD